MIRSLRLRILVYASLASAVVLGLLGGGLYVIMRHWMVEQFNQSLLNEARTVASTAEQHGETIVFDYDPDEMPKFVTRDHPDYFEAWIDPGGVIRSPSLGSADLPRPADGSSVSYKKLILPDGRYGRMVGMSFTTAIEANAGSDTRPGGQAHTVLLSVATESTGLYGSLVDLQWVLVCACGLAVVLTGAILLWVVAKAVRPVERVAHQIDSVGEGDLTQRLYAPDAPTELQPIVEKLNALLGRIESAFAREKAFAADVAHELRTPLSAILTTIEVCRSRPRDEAAYIAAIDKSREVARRMQAMVESLLTLARADSGQLVLDVRDTDAADLLQECWAFFASRAEARSLEVRWEVPAELPIRTDPEKLRMVFQNLFDNAVSYANDGGVIRVTGEIRGQSLAVEVANTGNRLEAGETSHLFERFWRGDKSRTDVGIHCGLGLSLCQRLTRLLDGQIQIQAAYADWFIARLTLPLSPGNIVLPANRPMAAPAPPSSRAIPMDQSPTASSAR